MPAEVSQSFETFQKLKNALRTNSVKEVITRCYHQLLFEYYIQLQSGEEIMFLLANGANLIKNQNIVDQFAENIRLCLLKPVC